MASAGGRRAHAGLGQAAQGALTLARRAATLRQTRSLARPRPHRDSLPQPLTHTVTEHARTQTHEPVLRATTSPATPLAASEPVAPTSTSRPDRRPSVPPLPPQSNPTPPPESKTQPLGSSPAAQHQLEPFRDVDSSPRPQDPPSLPPSPAQLDLPAKESVPNDLREHYAEPQLAADAVASKVPASRFGRLMHYGGLAAALGVGMASEAFRRSSNRADGASQSLLMSEANLERLVAKLSKMRGAALKLGQFLSIQG
ncbi:hypothetical protein JCM10295v2_006473 [Rhodotorula toruloides]